MLKPDQNVPEECEAKTPTLCWYEQLIEVLIAQKPWLPAIPAIEVRASATLPYGRLDHDATRRLFAELVIPRLDQAISNHNPT